MKVSEVGELGLINLLTEVVNQYQKSQDDASSILLIGIGDDTAAWYCDKTIELATTDSLIQDIHFTLNTIDWHKLGWKALAISLSDIAAMGGIPRHVLVTLGLPRDIEVEYITELYRGMIKLGNQFNTTVIGGDTSGAPLVMITTAVFGYIPGTNNPPLARSEAKIGDKIAVTGYLGGAAAGLKILGQEVKLPKKDRVALEKAFLNPLPRINEGYILLQKGVKAAIDISDGLIADLGNICRASKLSARVKIEQIPIHPAVKANFKEKALELALSGGEDYELLFTAGDEAISRVEKSASCKISVIGEVVEGDIGKIELINKNGELLTLVKTGWQHF